ncbi:MAG: DUF739 family protein [Clostridia bacterium]|nr:DUF739 family protein [Clostridia bacterium]
MAEYNYAKLLGRMREKGVTQEEVASKMGRNAATFSRKLNNMGYFTQSEISCLCDFLQIPDNEIGNYFFTK